MSIRTLVGAFPDLETFLISPYWLSKEKLYLDTHRPSCYACQYTRGTFHMCPTKYRDADGTLLGRDSEHVCLLCSRCYYTLLKTKFLVLLTKGYDTYRLRHRITHIQKSLEVNTDKSNDLIADFHGGYYKTYAEYVSSEYWMTHVRKFVGRCALCQSESGVSFYHKSLTRRKHLIFGHEEPEDAVAICNQCRHDNTSNMLVSNVNSWMTMKAAEIKRLALKSEKRKNVTKQKPQWAKVERKQKQLTQDYARSHGLLPQEPRSLFPPKPRALA